MVQETKNTDFFKNKVYFLQFISSVLVVMIHTYGTKDMTNIPLSYNIESFISFKLASVAVPLFFCLSGFLFFRNFKMDQLLTKWKKRVFSVLIPYFLWNLIYYIYFFVVTRLGITNGEPVSFDIKTLIDAIFCFKYNEVFWFMFQLIIFILIAPLLYYLLKQKIIGLVFLGALCAAFSFGLDSGLTNTFIRFPMTDSLFFYAFGAWLGLHASEKVQKENGKALIGAAALVVSIVILFVSPSYPIFSLLSKFLLVIAFYYLSNLFSFKTFPKILICSFPIYTVHEIILEVFNKIFSRIIPDNSNLILIDYFVSPLITILIIIGLAYFIKRFLPFVYRLLWGKR